MSAVMRELDDAFGLVDGLAAKPWAWKGAGHKQQPPTKKLVVLEENLRRLCDVSQLGPHAESPNSAIWEACRFTGTELHGDLAQWCAASVETLVGICNTFDLYFLPCLSSATCVTALELMITIFISIVAFSLFRSKGLMQATAASLASDAQFRTAAMKVDLICRNVCPCGWVVTNTLGSCSSYKCMLFPVFQVA